MLIIYKNQKRVDQRLEANDAGHISSPKARRRQKSWAREAHHAYTARACLRHENQAPDVCENRDRWSVVQGALPKLMGNAAKCFGLPLSGKASRTRSPSANKILREIMLFSLLNEWCFCNLHHGRQHHTLGVARSGTCGLLLQLAPQYIKLLEINLSIAVGICTKVVSTTQTPSLKIISYHQAASVPRPYAQPSSRTTSYQVCP